MSFSVTFSNKIKEGTFDCIDDYSLTTDISKYKTYSDLCSLCFSNSLFTIDSIQSSIDKIKLAISCLLSQPQSFNRLTNISNFVFLKIVFSQLSDLTKIISTSNKGFLFISEKESVSFSRQDTKDLTNKTSSTLKEKDISEIATPTFNRIKPSSIDDSSNLFQYKLISDVNKVSVNNNIKEDSLSDSIKNDVCIKDLLSAVQELKEKKMITLEERAILKEKIIEKDEEFLSFLGAESVREKDKNELIRQMRRYLKGFN